MLHECQGCSIAKGHAKSISTTTGTRAAKADVRVIRDVYGKKSGQSTGGKKYVLMIRNDFTRSNAAVYFMRSKEEVSIIQTVPRRLSFYWCVFSSKNCMH